MSSEALAWAFKSDVKPSSVKFTLVALCECANYQTGKIFPSIKHLCQITGQDRKTVISNIGKLLSDGWICETGERVGRTGQIKVYQANIGTVPRTEQSQERNGSAFPLEQSQKRDTEPSIEPSRYIDKAALPDCIPVDAWQGWVEMRKQRKRPLTDRAKTRAINKLEALHTAGHDIAELLDRSTINGWLDIYEPKGTTNARNSQHSTEPTNPMVRAVLASQAKRAADGQRLSDDWA
jgi:hypothetical protein